MHSKPFFIALISLLCYYLAIPPLNIWFLAFIPPIFWFFLIKQDFSPSLEIVPNVLKKHRFFHWFRSFTGQLYLAAFIFWGLLLTWLPSPHPAIWIGWFFLTGLMASYFPLYITAARRLNRHFRIPFILASPIAWIGSEWLRKHILTGFTLCSLEHAFYKHPVMIQTAEFIGEYGVSGLILMIGTAAGIGIDLLIFTKKRPASGILSLLSASLILIVMVGYGHYKVVEIEKICTEANEKKENKIRIALLQDPTYYEFPVPQELNLRVHQQYIRLSEKSVLSHPDLIVWPEGTFSYPYFAFEPNAKLPVPEGSAPLSPEEEKNEIRKIEERQERSIGKWVESLNAPVLFGLCSNIFTPKGETVCNSALFCKVGEPEKRYDKRARVMFGEYIPFLENLPDDFPLKTLCEPISAGKELGNISVGQYTALVSICFESCYARFLRSQLNELNRKGIEPNFLINISNDAWFFGGVENEYHEATYPFRAVEAQKYYLTAVHGGVSSGITPAGIFFIQGEKGKSEPVIAEFAPVTLKPFLNGKGLWGSTFCVLMLFLSFFPSRKRQS